MASGPITSWEIDGETVETVSDFSFGGSKITADGDCSHEIKRRLLLGRKVMTNLDSILKSRDIYAPNIGTPQYVRQILTRMKEEINSNIIIVGDFNTPLTTMDRSTKQKINKETQTLEDIMDQLDLIDIYRTFHPKTVNFTFFSSAHGTFSRIDHTLGHKFSLGKFKKN